MHILVLVPPNTKKARLNDAEIQIASSIQVTPFRDTEIMTACVEQCKPFFSPILFSFTMFQQELKSPIDVGQPVQLYARM